MSKYVSLPQPDGEGDRERRNEPVLGTTEVARQHFVPRFYLEGFTEADGLLDARDVLSWHPFRGKPEMLGFERGFNDLGQLDTGEKISTESWLGDGESDAAPILRALAEDPDILPRLHPSDERVLARFLAAQSFRVPERRAEVARMRINIANQMRPAIKYFAMNTMGMTDEEADAYVDRYAASEDGWFLNTERDPSQEAMISASFLAEVNGNANLLQAMPWRIGTTSSAIYTSDNPMAGIQRFADRYGGAFAAQRYYYPMNSRLLLVMGPFPRPSAETDDAFFGSRVRKDFGPFETSIARHAVSWKATRFLYGPGPYVDKACAGNCLARLQQAQREDHVRFTGRPWTELQEHTPLGLFNRSPDPDLQGLHRALVEYASYQEPVSRLRLWLREMQFMLNHESCGPKRRDLLLDVIRLSAGSNSHEIHLRRAVADLQSNIELELYRDYAEHPEKLASLLQKFGFSQS